uniref:transporter substrate-binding domain-containing protein n=1 Tax=Cephaloticoccus sp. TaxID=1985742 RepID=UPI004049E34D
MDDNYPPYVFKNEDGQLQGILVDQWQQWEKVTGTKAELHAMDWKSALDRMQAGEFDVIDTIFNTPERRAWLDFTASYANIDVAVFFDKRITGIVDLSSLRGFAVAVKAGDTAILQLQAAGVNNLLLYPSYESIVQAAADLKVNVFVVDEPCAYYYLNKLQIQNQFKSTAPINQGQFSRGVTKGNTALLNYVSRGFYQISADDLEAIEKKWGGRVLHDGHIQYVIYGAATAGLIILLLVVWNRTLQRQVERRTRLLKNSERHLAAERNFASAVVDHAGVIVVVLDRAGCIRRLNLTGEQLTGYKEEELLGEPIWSTGLLPVDETILVQREAFDKMWVEKLRAKTGRYTNHWLNREGNLHLIDWFNTLLTDAKGEPEFIVAVGVDITERRSLEDRFMRSQRMEAMGSLVAGIAHDLNNIFSPIIMITTLLRRSVTNPEEVKMLDMMDQSSKRGAGIIRQLVTYSRGSTLERNVVATGALLEEIASLARETFPREIRCRTQFSSDLNCILADAIQIHQVLLNLCVNARDAMPDGGELELRASNVELSDDQVQTHEKVAPGSFVMIAVRDTGTGIPAMDLEKIFEPFFTTKPPGKGTGLGLSTTIGIVRTHGGFMEVQSALGEGTTFKIYLPATKESPASSSALPFVTDRNEGIGRILLVDDEPLVATAVSRLLEQQNHQVVTARDGLEALAKLADAGPFDLVVTDLVMPNMNGLALIRELRKREPSLKVIACTGMAPEEMQLELGRLGIKQVLRKPILPRDLLQAITQALQNETT